MASPVGIRGAGTDIPVRRWLDAAQRRVSGRAYEPESVSNAEAEHLRETVEGFDPFGGVRIVVLREVPREVFTGWLLGVYGKVTSPSALVFLGDRRAPMMAARVGYTAEGIILEATDMGLATCWIGGGVKRGKVTDLLGLGPHEHVYSISALGRSPSRKTFKERATAVMVQARTRKPTEEIAPESAEWPEWARAGIEAARIAPSAKNRQPWRFRYEGGRVVVAYEGPDTPRISKKLDCGIAMLHFELGVRGHGDDGCWDLLEGRDVARWVSGGSLGP